MNVPNMGELIAVPPVKTVIQLSDTRDAGAAREIVASFVLTEDAEFALSTVCRDLAQGRGRGYFLQGAFGTGKSHLLSLLTLILSQPEAKFEGRLREIVAPLAGRRFLTVPVSLVEHRSREYLEDIVLRAIQAALGEVGGGAAFPAGARAGLPSRGEVFDRLKEIMREKNFAGLVLIIDELSEFLRAKPDGRSFNEDIRFLQYLGEVAAEFPAWIVASLQERLEETGAIAPEAFAKIKDRYPVRLRLSGRHIKELISSRLIQRKPPAAPYISSLYERLKRALGELPFSREELMTLYPVHPLTVRFLEDLKQLFSQHRGVVDFIHYQLAGDPARRLPGLLSGPADRLLTPDLIFDHFRTRIREIPETNPYSEVVVRAWELDSPLADPEERELALKLVKILALAAMSPLPAHLTPRRLLQLTLYTLTDLDPAVNQEYIANLLDRMYREGPYLSRAEGPDGASPEYRIDLEADISLFVRRRLAYIRENLLPEDRRVFTRLGAWVDEPFLPLKAWLEEPVSARTVSWQHTARSGRLILTALDELSAEHIKDLARELKESELDFVLIVGEAFQTERAARHLKEVLLPAVAEAGVPGFLFWLPKEPEGTETLREALAYDLLAAECREGETANAQRALPYLEGVLPDYRLKVAEVYRQAYFKGRVYTLPEAEPVSPEELGYLPFPTLLEKLAAPVLSRRYPRHQEVAPALAALPPGTVLSLWEEFLLPGEYKAEGRTGRLAAAIEGALLPLGLVKKQGRTLSLNIDPGRNELVRTVVEAVAEGPRPLAEVYTLLRHGPFGLTRESFQLLILALIASGNLEAWREGRRLGTSQISPYTFSKIDALGRGQILTPELQKELISLSFLPARLKRGSFTAGLQQEVWGFLVEWKKELLAKIQAVRARLAELKSSPALAALSLERSENELGRLEALAGEIKTSYGSREGLERFLAACRSEPYLDRYLERLNELAAFLENYAERFILIHRYLTDPALTLPPDSDLARQRATLLNMLADEAVILESEYRERLSAGFSAFQEEYRREYIAAHNREVGPARFEPYAALRESQAYRVLSSLAPLESLSVPDDKVKVDRELARILNLACPRGGEDLVALPVCRCGFTLGQHVSLPPVSELAQTIERGVREYVAALRAPAVRAEIQSLAAALAEVGRGKEAEPLKELLKVTPEDADLPARLAAILNRNTLALLRQALARRALVVRRNLDELYEKLVGRSFTPERLEAIFQEWLRGPGDLTEGCYVRLEGGREKEVPLAREEQPAFLPTGTEDLADLLAELAYERNPTQAERRARLFLSRLAAAPPDEVQSALRGLAEEEGLMAAVRPLTGIEAALAGCRAALRLQGALLTLEGAPLPDDFALWEERTPLLARLDLYLAQAEAYLKAAGLYAGFPLATYAERAGQVGKLYGRSFRAFTAAHWQPEEPLQGRAGLPLTLDGLLQRPEFQPAGHPAGLYLVFLDGLRLDLGELLLREILGRGGWQIVTEGLIWAYPPPVTEVQLGFLRAAGFNGRITSAEEVALPDLPYLRSTRDWPASEILRFNFIDEKVHTSPAGYFTFLAEVGTAAERELYPFLAEVPEGAGLLLFGDHGYVRGEEVKEHASAYLHGQGLPADTLVPWYFLKRRGEG
ncbi:MAG: hypothetical protein PWQ86_1519 [Bacillota bacterium]|nr:hypothetical protein [Bacillota bacterium]